jgi:signal transduction histidine kinase
MKKIRWTLLLLALGIALPAGLIVQRAIASLELESAIRHEAVAERIFDEMERSLSGFLLREESRPPTDYAPVSLSSESFPEPSPGAELRRAEFADVDEPFIVGWFSLDVVGRARTLAIQPGDAQRVANAVRNTLGPHAPLERIDTLAEASAPAPGRTRLLKKDRFERAESAAADEEAVAESSAYDVFQSLNRAQRLRSERQDKALQKSSSRGVGKAEAPTALESPRTMRVLAQAGALEAEKLRADDDTAFAEIEASGIDPLIGRSTPNGDIVLARSVWQGSNVERQGLVLDRAALVAWLETRVLAESGLSNRVQIKFGAPALLGPQAEIPRRYLHRFAEPFEALIARLDLDALPGLGSERPIYALALLLTLVATIGFYTVHRMTRVVVDYAERRSNFVAAVSHELKTPLTSIRMYGEMLRDGLVSSDEKRAEYYTTITDESERLSRLIDNVLEFSRLEQNRRDLNLVVGSLSDAIRDATEKLRTHIEREGFHLKLDLDGGLPAVQFDRDGVTQLVFNLVDNALKYARHAETREIEIGLHLENDRVELRVRDFGPGVPDDQLRRVFEPFYRIGEELTRTTEGTGIGLALVKELAEGMGAFVFGRNASGGGFEVCIAFNASGSG